MSESFVPECKKGYSIKNGGKTVNFTNRSQYQETVEVNLISASWDDVQQEWAPGITYSVALTAKPGESVSHHLAYTGCGKERGYAAAYSIGITGQSTWLYQMTNNDPYHEGELGNSNDTINIVSNGYNNYTATFSNGS